MKILTTCFLASMVSIASLAAATDLFSSGTGSTSRFPDPEVIPGRSLPRPGTVDDYTIHYVGGTYWAYAWGTNLYRSNTGGPEWSQIVIPEFRGQSIVIGGDDNQGILLGKDRLLRIERGALINDDGVVELIAPPTRQGVADTILKNRHFHRLTPWKDGWLLTDGAQSFFSEDGLQWTAGRWDALTEAEFGSMLIDLIPVGDQLLAITEDGRLLHSRDGARWAGFPEFPVLDDFVVRRAAVAAGQGRLVVMLASDSNHPNQILCYEPGSGWHALPVRRAATELLSLSFDPRSGNFVLISGGWAQMGNSQNWLSETDENPNGEYLFSSRDGRTWTWVRAPGFRLQAATSQFYVRTNKGLSLPPYRSFGAGPAGWVSKSVNAGNSIIPIPGEPDGIGPPALPQPASGPVPDPGSAPEIRFRPGAPAEAGELLAAARSGDADANLKLAASLLPLEISGKHERQLGFVANPRAAEAILRQALADSHDHAAPLLAQLLQGWIPNRQQEIQPALAPYRERSAIIATEIGMAMMTDQPEAGLELLQQAMTADPDYDLARHAFNYFSRRESAISGDPEALFLVSQAAGFDVVLHRLPIPIRGAKAEQYLKQAAELGYDPALEAMGESIAENPNRFRNQTVHPYVPIIHDQADAGNAVALRIRGRFRLSGEFTPIRRDPEGGTRDLKQAAEVGDALAMTYLGQLYSTGQITPIQIEEAISWLEKAVAAGLEGEQARLEPLLQRRSRATAHKLPLDGRAENLSPRIYDALSHVQRNQFWSQASFQGLFRAIWADSRYGAVEEDLARELMNLQPGNQLLIADTGGRSFASFNQPLPEALRIPFSRAIPAMMPIDDLQYFTDTLQFGNTVGPFVFFLRETQDDPPRRAILDQWFDDNLKKQLTNASSLGRFLDTMLGLAQGIEPEPTAEYRAYLKARVTPILRDHPKANELIPVAQQRELYDGNFTTREENWKNRLVTGDQPLATMLADRQKSTEAAGEVRAFLRKHFLEFWFESNTSNAYAPLREEISRFYAEINLMEESDRIEARHMLFLPLADADHHVNGDIPDFLYNWINPDKPGE